MQTDVLQEEWPENCEQKEHEEGSAPGGASGDLVTGSVENERNIKRIIMLDHYDAVRYFTTVFKWTILI